MQAHKNEVGNDQQKQIEWLEQELKISKERNGINHRIMLCVEIESFTFLSRSARTEYKDL